MKLISIYQYLLILQQTLNTYTLLWQIDGLVQDYVEYSANEPESREFCTNSLKGKCDRWPALGPVFGILFALLWPLLLTWFNFNPSMDK